MILYPHCKINLGLNVVARREDGFHELSSVLYPIKGLTDMLEIVKSGSFEFSSSGLVVDCPLESNLCYRAYMLLKEGYDIPPVKMHLHKVTPMGAGLGGGSSDATFVLKALNELFEMGLTLDQLQEYSLRLGSDTPFFLYDGAMEVAGRGDILKPLKLDLGGLYIKIIKPNIHVSTKEAFAGITPRRSELDITTILSKDISEWRDLLVNDFERSIFSNHPTLAQIKETLYQDGAIYAAMSGSGSAIFGIFRQEPEMEKIDGMFQYCGKL